MQARLLPFRAARLSLRATPPQLRHTPFQLSPRKIHASATFSKDDMTNPTTETVDAVIPPVEGAAVEGAPAEYVLAPAASSGPSDPAPIKF
jgi:hypothetical protein